ncbi:Delta-like protein C [Dufourea novaeangliae]|uniref:Delta-like protein C n=1 Tax=Dufourea novaeangliae TaxID=178035 RepID=A0A154P294_DUFNO|nr:Delta-like protein C [Dufourea novaeangliae]
MILLVACLSLLIGPGELGTLNNGLSVGVTTVLGLSALPFGFATGPRYVPKWKKQACEIPASQHPNSHYVCDEAGEVKCLPGWTGDLCDVPICRKGCDPLQGYCRRPGECRCKLGFYGELCDKCVALPGCQHGSCNVSFECSCDPGWKGMFCSEPICGTDCLASQGYCEKPGECSGDPRGNVPPIINGTVRVGVDWVGKDQSANSAPFSQGVCMGLVKDHSNVAAILGGLVYFARHVSSFSLCSKGCSREHGTCRRPGTCWCRVGWTGPNCTECVPYPGCVHGSCKRPWECRCEPGWAGDLCNEKLTYCEEHPDTCRNNATCISMTKEDGDYRCVCPLGYMGRQCQIKTMVPSTDLMPPMLDSTELDTKPQMILIKPQVVEDSQNLEDKDKDTTKEEEQTVEPLGPIVITDPPSTIDPAATVGKWPTEPPTEIPMVEMDDENET